MTSCCMWRGGGGRGPVCMTQPLKKMNERKPDNWGWGGGGGGGLQGAGGQKMLKNSMTSFMDGTAHSFCRGGCGGGGIRVMCSMGRSSMPPGFLPTLTN